MLSVLNQQNTNMNGTLNIKILNGTLGFYDDAVTNKLFCKKLEYKVLASKF